MMKTVYSHLPTLPLGGNQEPESIELNTWSLVTLFLNGDTIYYPVKDGEHIE